MKGNKKVIKNFLGTIICTIVIVLSVCTAYAADVKINSNSYAVGDTVTYSASLQADKKCSGINAVISYDSNSLELDEKSLNVPNLGQTIANAGDKGTVKFVATDIQNGFDFTKDKLLISATFKIKDGASDNDIKIEIKEIYDNDIKDIPADSYTVKETVKKGKQEGKIVNPVDGLEAMSENDAVVKQNDNTNTHIEDNTNKTAVVWIVVGAVAAVVILAIVAFIYRKKKMEQDSAVILSDND